MFPDLTTIHRVSQLEEALRLLAAGGGAVAPLAGGTALGIWRKPGIQAVLDLWGLPLAGLEETSTTIRLGAMATAETLLREPADGYWGGALSEAADAVGATTTRNLVTLGGNLCAPFPWADLPVILLALEARVEIRSPGRTETISLEELLQGPPSRILAGGKLLTAVEIPVARAGEGACFRTMKQTRFDYALVSAGASLGIQDGRIAWGRVVIGALEGRTRRVPEAEELLAGQSPSEELWRRVGAATVGAIRPMADPRAGKEYRREMAGVMVERAAAEAARRAGEGGSR